jgi:hypothetical protein
MRKQWRALRDTLKAKAIETTHAETLELIAKAFGYENWNVLSAKIEATEPATGDERTISVAAQNEPAPPKTLYCSFCGKSQHEVRKLIAGPPPVFICDECVDICTDVVEPDDDIELLRLMKANDESGKQADRALFELARGTSTEELAHYVERSRRGVERSRLALQGIQRKLAVPDDDMLTLPRHLRDKRREDLVVMQQKAQRDLKRYEGALSIARTVLGERRQ